MHMDRLLHPNLGSLLWVCVCFGFDTRECVSAVEQPALVEALALTAYIRVVFAYPAKGGATAGKDTNPHRFSINELAWQRRYGTIRCDAIQRH